MPGQPKRLTQGTLDALPPLPTTAARRAAFVAAAEEVWELLMAQPGCRPIGERMLRNMRQHPIQART